MRLTIGLFLGLTTLVWSQTTPPSTTAPPAATTSPVAPTPPLPGAPAAAPVEPPAKGPLPQLQGRYDRPTSDRHQSRSVVMARHGMVATSQPLAAQAGLKVLLAGGNAADAAIAANAVLGVVEPMSCGLGGDLFVLYWDAKTQQLSGLNASGRSPQALSVETFTSRKLTAVPETGPLSWTVPGCIDGWDELRARFGTKPLGELLQPAIHYAEEGFPVTEVIAGDWAIAAAGLAKYSDSRATWLLDDDRAPRVGEVFRNPQLAATLKLIAEQGRDAFYQGPIAESIVAFSEANGGCFTVDDFRSHRSEWVDPISTKYRGYEVWELPPNGQGLAVLQMLNILEPYDLKAMGHNSPEYLHLLIEAKKLAFADRAKFYSDPAFAEIPVAKLVSKEYASAQRKRIDPNKAAVIVPAGDPQLQSGDTIYLTVTDEAGNCCSLIQSNYYGFGSGMTPGKLGFVLQNRGALFSLEPAHANCVAGGKRPFHTIIPGMATRDGKPWLCFGVMGGDMQPQGHVQVLVNMIDFGMNVQQAGDAARVRHLGSATPTGQPMDPAGGKVACESGVTAAVRAALTERGHVIDTQRQSFGGYQAIRIDEVGTFFGGTDPRKDGAAVGY
ncbi:MAG: gamma-glutamyltransferase [Planctomycetaceae bacterium]